MHFPESFPDLETKRLKLTELRREDAKTLLDMRSDGRISEFIARKKMHTEGEAEDLINKCLSAFKNKAGIAWAGRKKHSNELIGTCGFNSIEPENNHAEIGGEMATQYWGSGLAQEAFLQIISYGIRQMQLQTIEAKVDPKNRSAIRLMERFGFVKEAHYKNRIYFKDSYRDMAVFTLHRESFKLPSFEKL